MSTIEIVASHEFIEAATDPQPINKPTYQFLMGQAWYGEVADQCAKVYTEGHFTVTTSWSNAVASANTDPCVPAPPGAFFDAALLPATQSAARGMSVTFEAQGWSTDVVPDWGIQAYAYPLYPNGFTPDVRLDATMINNAREAHLTATVPANTAHNASATVMLVSQRCTSTTRGRAC
jgi:hypothetical protein